MEGKEWGHPSLRRPDDVEAIGFATSLLMSGPIPFPSSASGPFSPCFTPLPTPAANPPPENVIPQSSRRPRGHKGWMAACVHALFTPGVDAFARSALVLTFPAGLRLPQSWVALFIPTRAKYDDGNCLFED
jgi:hypothetical protein